MYKLVSLFFAFVLATAAFAQHGGSESTYLDGNAKHTITYNRGFIFDSYTVDGRESNADEVETLLPYVPEANDQWNTGNVLRYIRRHDVPCPIEEERFMNIVRSWLDDQSRI